MLPRSSYPLSGSGISGGGGREQSPEVLTISDSSDDSEMVSVSKPAKQRKLDESPPPSLMDRNRSVTPPPEDLVLNGVWENHTLHCLFRNFSINHTTNSDLTGTSITTTPPPLPPPQLDTFLLALPKTASSATPLPLVGYGTPTQIVWFEFGPTPTTKVQKGSLTLSHDGAGHLSFTDDFHRPCLLLYQSVEKRKQAQAQPQPQTQQTSQSPHCDPTSELVARFTSLLGFLATQFERDRRAVVSAVATVALLASAVAASGEAASYIRSMIPSFHFLLPRGLNIKSTPNSSSNCIGGVGVRSTAVGTKRLPPPRVVPRPFVCFVCGACKNNYAHSVELIEDLTQEESTTEDQNRSTEREAHHERQQPQPQPQPQQRRKLKLARSCTRVRPEGTSPHHCHRCGLVLHWKEKRSPSSPLIPPPPPPPPLQRVTFEPSVQPKKNDSGECGGSTSNRERVDNLSVASTLPLPPLPSESSLRVPNSTYASWGEIFHSYYSSSSSNGFNHSSSAAWSLAAAAGGGLISDVNTGLPSPFLHSGIWLSTGSDRSSSSSNLSSTTTSASSSLLSSSVFGVLSLRLGHDLLWVVPACPCGLGHVAKLLLWKDRLLLLTWCTLQGEVVHSYQSELTNLTTTTTNSGAEEEQAAVVEKPLIQWRVKSPGVLVLQTTITAPPPPASFWDKEMCLNQLQVLTHISQS